MFYVHNLVNGILERPQKQHFNRKTNNMGRIFYLFVFLINKVFYF